MPIPELSPILEAVQAVRARYVPQAEGWADSIRAGFPPALDRGKALLKDLNVLHDELEALAGIEIPSEVTERLVGVQPVIDAVLVAIGEVDEILEPTRP